MSPLKINLCLHYAISLGDDPWLGSGAPIVESTMRDLHDAGLLMRTGQDSPRYRATPLLLAYVAMLEATPLPASAFVDPRTGQSIMERAAPIFSP